MTPFILGKELCDISFQLPILEQLLGQSYMGPISGYNMEIGWLNRLEREKREILFLKKVSNKKGFIDFWKFFEYMKNRTHDIKNIN